CRGMRYRHSRMGSARGFLRPSDRLLDLRHQFASDRLLGARPDMHVEDAAVAADEIGFRHAVDAPAYRSAPAYVDAYGGEGIAHFAEETQRVLGLVLVVQPGEAVARIALQFHQEGLFLTAGRTPGRPDIDQSDMPLEIDGSEAGQIAADEWRQ